MLVKRVHKALKLRHHKHSGKILHHRHTSYRVLFLLMLTPIAMMALVGQLAGASDYIVSASVPATIPKIAPVITSPKDGFTTTNGQVRVSGTCPLGHVAGVVAIYEEKRLLGAAPCTVNGTFSVSVTLSYGAHVLIATVISITKDVGMSSQPLSVIRKHPFSIMTNLSISPPPIVISAKDPFIVIGPDSKTIWSGSFKGGVPPYDVSVDWGDGTVDKHYVADISEQSFAHAYPSQQAYTIVIRAEDANHDSATLYSVALTPSLGQVAATEGNTWQMPFTLETVQRYLIYIYVITLFSLTFLWYLEHGRPLVLSAVHSKRKHRLHRPRLR